MEFSCLVQVGVKRSGKSRINEHAIRVFRVFEERIVLEFLDVCSEGGFCWLKVAQNFETKRSLDFAGNHDIRFYACC